MTIEEWVERSREEIRRKFGDVGEKVDCANHHTGKGCAVCLHHDTGRRVFLQCELDVCYFYRRKENQ